MVSVEKYHTVMSGNFRAVAITVQILCLSQVPSVIMAKDRLLPNLIMMAKDRMLPNSLHKTKSGCIVLRLWS